MHLQADKRRSQKTRLAGRPPRCAVAVPSLCRPAYAEKYVGGSSLGLGKQYQIEKVGLLDGVDSYLLYPAYLTCKPAFWQESR